jgi:RND superfamily putative drug exporter
VFEQLGRAMYRWRWPVLGIWALAVLAGGVAGGQIFDRTSSVDSLRPDAESVRAERLLEQRLGTGPEVFAIALGRHPREPALVDSLIAVAGQLRAIDGVVEVHDGYTAPGGQEGSDGLSYLVRVELRPGLPDAELERLAEQVAALLHTIDAPQVLVGGEVLAERAFAEQAVRDAAVGESVALVVLFAALVVILGGVVAAGLPLLVAIGAVTTTLLGLLALIAVTPVSEYAVNVVTLLGIGLAVDYTILLIYRFREERAADPAGRVQDWLARTVATAGRTVLIAGTAVAAAMVGLAFFAEPLLGSMAQGGAVVVVLATAAALTAVPALLAVAHRRIPPARGTIRIGLLARLAGYAHRRPGPVALVVTGGLLVLALPFTMVNLASSDARALPAGSEARQAYEVYQRDFTGRAAPVVVLAERDPADPAVRDLLNNLLAEPAVAQVLPRIDTPPGITVIDVTPRGETAGETSRALVRAIRAMPVDVPLLVTGPAAEVVDYADSVGGRLPVVVGVLLLATMVLLFLLTGSVVIPLKALVLNALTLLATLGVLVVVFQWGWGAPLLGFTSWGAIDVTTPVLLFVFLFGLTMDYEVFLLSRIKEERDRGSGAAAVPRGIVASGPVVTAAAISITIVFLGFVFGDLVAVKEIGVGMAVAIVLDVTVVRGLLLPAMMALLGDWNWWAPGPLRRLHARIAGIGHISPVYVSEPRHSTGV